MNRWAQWAYATGLFLLMGSVAGAGFYQYKDNLSIPYNINLFNCVATPLATAVSCTSMTLQNSSGVEIFTTTQPGIVQLNSSPTSVGIGDGANASQGAKADAAATDGFSASSIISLLKGILNNVVTPITVNGSLTTTPAATPQSSVIANQPTVNTVVTGSPQNVTIANTPTVSVVSPLGVAVVNNVAVTTPTPLQVTTASPLGAAVVNNVAVTPPTPLNVTVGSSPVAVSIASSPVNVTGTFTASSSSPTTVNLEQIQNQTIASPTAYGTAPLGSVQGVNAFVTGLPASPLSVGIAQTPLNVTVGNVASPAGVAVVNNVAVTPPSPLAVTLPSSPISVGISASPLDVAIFGPTPLAVTLPASPLNVALSTAASPMSVGISSGSSPVNVTVGNTASPAGVAVVNAPTVVLSGSPVSVGITAGSSPVNVTTPSPLNVTGSLTANVSSPIGVNIASSPVQVTLPASPVSVGLSGSPVSVGIASGSSPLNVTGNFTTSVSSPLGVVPFNGASPQNVTLASSPVAVAISTVSSPINVTGNISTTISSPAAMNLVQVQNQAIASPSTYGVAPVGSVAGVNAFVTNNVGVTPPTPLNVTMGTPLNVTIAGPTPLAVTLPSTPVEVAISSVSSPINVTGNLSTTPPAIQTVNVASLQSQNLASPSTYGVAPVGSVQGVNAFITNAPSVTTTPAVSPQNVTIAQTPLNVTVGNVASPAGVAVVNNVAVTTPTPLQVTLPASPISVGIAGPTPLNVTVSGSPQNMTLTVSPVGVGVVNNVAVTPPTPLQITLPASPISVGIAGPSPLGVTITSSPVAVNEVQRQGVNLASPSTYGIAPVGSVGGVNAFVTNNVAVTTPTPLQITLPASPVSVGLSASPAGVAVVNSPTVTLSGTPISIVQTQSPQNMTLVNSPVAVSIASSPVNVTGNISTTISSPAAMNLTQVQNVNVASPSTYGVAPVGSTLGVNAFVTNSPTVVLSGSPVSVGIAGPTPLNVTVSGSPQNMTLSASPLSVAIAGPTPLAVTLPSTPVEVAISTVSSPINVTGNLSTTPPAIQTVNVASLQSQNLASPSTYGVAPVGSVQGVNAFVTNNVAVTTPTPLQVTLPASPVSVGLSASPAGVAVVNNVAVTTPTPLQVTLPASPISVGIAGPTPLNVTVGGIVSPQGVTITSSPVAVNEVQRQGVNLASPSTYGVAPVGSVGGVNAFVTNNVSVTTPTPLQVTLPASPISVGIAGPSPLNVTVGSPQNITISASPLSVVQTQSPQNMTLVNSPVAVSIASSPVNVTGSFTANSSSPTTINLAQVQNVNIASPSTYGVAPVGSTQGVNAYVTNGNPNGSATMANSSPITIANDQTPVQINIAQEAGRNVASPQTYGTAPVGSVIGVNAFVTSLPATPLNVTIAQTPLNITLPGTPLNTTVSNANPNGSAIMANSSPVTVASDQTPIQVNLDQLNGRNLASPQTYGVAPVGSVIGVNAFVTSLPATPLNVTLAGPTPLNVTVGSPQNITIGPSNTPTQMHLTITSTQTNSVIKSSKASLTKVYCATAAAVTGQNQEVVNFYDASSYANATVGAIHLTIPVGANTATGTQYFPNFPPNGDEYTNGIVVVAGSVTNTYVPATTPSGQVVNMDCSISTH